MGQKNDLKNKVQPAQQPAQPTQQQQGIPRELVMQILGEEVFAKHLANRQLTQASAEIGILRQKLNEPTKDEELKTKD